MSIMRAELKNQARQQMSGKFGALFGCCLVFWGIGFVCTKGFSFILMPGLLNLYKGMFDVVSFTSSDAIGDIMVSDAMRLSAYSNIANALSLAYWVLIFPIISVGLSQVLLDLTYGDVPQVSRLFEPYKTKFGKSIGTIWLKKLFEILWGIPFYFLMVICVGIMIGVMAQSDSFFSSFVYMFLEERDWGSAIFSVMGIVFVFFALLFMAGLILLVPYYIIIYKYAMTIYIMNEQPGLSASECINESKRIMMGRRWEFFVLKLSFIPWFLMCLIPIVGWLSLIYTIPYMQVTVTDYYHKIKTPAEQEKGGHSVDDIVQIIDTAANNIVVNESEY